MDDTQMSRASDAAATRKRRSSILKTQRPPRTPFSELEFNVATPTDTAKSRRVSFSRRTGVAEFVTNEATTTWKNFYEEHNRSQESSVNESGSKHAGHLGKRIFDQQFEEVEVDFIGIQNAGHNMSSSLANFQHDVVTLECTDDLNLPQASNMELSTFPNNTKLFSEPTITGGEVTDRLDINFSLIQPVLDDDLDDIQNELKNNFQKPRNMSDYIEVDLDMTKVAEQDDMSITETVVSPKVESVHFETRPKTSSERYDIENDDLDEIQRDLNHKFGTDVSSFNSSKSSKVSMTSNDNVDKENIAINPYAPVKEAENFAVNNDDDKVLVFDGKRLTLQSDKEPPKAVDNQRKTIVLNLHDDLPNFVDDSIAQATGHMDITQLKKNMVLDDMSITENINKRTLIYDEDEGNISVTLAVAPKILTNKSLHFDEATIEGNMSMTKVVPTKIAEKRSNIFEKSLNFEQAGNMSMTKVIPTKITEKCNILDNKSLNFDDVGNMSMTKVVPTKIAEKRKTIVFNDNEGDMSITRALPTIFNDKRKSVYDDKNMSITQAIPSNIMSLKLNRSMLVEDVSEKKSSVQISKPNEGKSDKRRTIVYEDDSCNISVTQAIPSNILEAEKSPGHRAIVFDSSGNISVTQEVTNIGKDVNIEAKDNVVQSNNVRRRTIVYENDTGDISITQSVPHNIIKHSIVPLVNTVKDNLKKSDSDVHKRKTIVFDNDTGDISITQAISSNQILCALKSEENKDLTFIQPNSDSNKRRTIVFEDKDADISMTQALPSSVVECYNLTNEVNKVSNNPFQNSNKRRTIVYEKEEGDISMTQTVNTKPIELYQNVQDDLEEALNEALHCRKSKGHRTIEYEKDDVTLSGEKHQNDPSHKYLGKIIEKARDENPVENYREESLPEVVCVREENVDDYNDEVLDVSMADVNYAEMMDTSSKEVVEKMLLLNCEDESSNSYSLSPSLTKIADEISKSIKNDICKVITQPLERIISHDKENVSKIVPSEVSQLVNRSANMSTAENIANLSKTDPSSELNHPWERSMTKIKEDLSNSIKNDVSKVINQTLEESMKAKEHLSKISNDMSKTIESVEAMSKIKEDLSKSIKNDMSKIMNDSIAQSMSTIKEDLSASFKNNAKVNESILKNNIIVFQTTLNQVKETENREETTHELTENKTTINDESKKTEAKLYKENKAPLIEVKNSEEMTIPVAGKSALPKSILNDLLDMSTSDCQVVDEIEPIQNVQEVEYPLKPIEQAIPEESSKESVNKDEMFYITHDVDDEAEININNKEKLENKIHQLEYEEPDGLDINRQMDKINEFLNEKPNNRHFEKMYSSTKASEESHQKKSKAPIKTADDTNELLEMISDFTDKTMMRKLNALDEIEEYEEGNKELQAIIDKSSVEPSNIPKRQSFVRRQSIVMSREDLLNNISMAGAALKSCIDFDDDSDDDEDEKSSAKSIRMSNEVVKTLQFDESVTESSILEKNTPLKKTAFGETSYMYDTKAKVIPDYMNVSDGIKELIDDLVKPDADAVPFDSSLAHKKKVTRKISTHSSEVQANIVTSSQIDLTNSDEDGSVDLIEKAVNRSVSRALSHSLKATNDSEHTLASSSIDNAKSESVKTIDSYKTTDSLKTIDSFQTAEPLKLEKRAVGIKTPEKEHVRESTPVLVFDMNNPLNNILLAPTSHEAHKYDPIPSMDIEKLQQHKHTKDDTEPQTLQYNVTKIKHNHQQSGDVIEIDNIKLDIDKRKSIETCTDIDFVQKDIEVNTIIVMKGNQELLQSNSSLTIVDDAQSRSAFDVKLSNTISPVEILSNEEMSEGISEMDADDRKSMKRSRDIVKSGEITPKPNKKIQKLSLSPVERSVKIEEGISRVTTVQRVECEIGKETKFYEEKMSMSKMDWNTELITKQPEKTDSSVNVVALIEKLPFIGRECEWESSSGDTWTFLLLHGRIRLSVVLEHRQRNSIRTRVASDTPVVSVNVETLHDTKDNLALLCVRFASDTMRWFAAMCRAAGDIPAALTRCARAATLARRWGRAMSEARAHLAFSLTPKGKLTLKVANLSIRCVFEVTTQLELVTETSEAPWVRATNLQVCRAFCAAPAPKVVAPSVDGLPRDWSHTPRAVWKIFKYLKHLRVDEDALFKIP